MEILLRIPLFLLGVAMVGGTLFSAIQTFVVPRSKQDGLTRTVFRTSNRIFSLRLRKTNTYEERDEIMAFFAPMTLLALPLVWLIIVFTGYSLMFWAMGAPGWRAAFTASGSSMLTLGFASLPDFISVILAFSEASIGLFLVALLVAYLPTMYAAFQRRESAVTLLQVRAGSPPSAIEMLKRYHRIRGLDKLDEIWANWELWFVEIEESHTSLPALVFFRSPQHNRSWVTAAGTIMDCAALLVSMVDRPNSPEAQLCLRAGFLAMRKIADFFNVDYNADPKPGDAISIGRDEFDEAYNNLAEAGLPLRPDRDQAWIDYAGWRVNYDTVLLALAAITMAPEAPWSSDRSFLRQRRKSKKKALLKA